MDSRLNPKYADTDPSEFLNQTQWGDFLAENPDLQSMFSVMVVPTQDEFIAGLKNNGIELPPAWDTSSGALGYFGAPQSYTDQILYGTTTPKKSTPDTVDDEVSDVSDDEPSTAEATSEQEVSNEELYKMELDYQALVARGNKEGAARLSREIASIASEKAWQFKFDSVSTLDAEGYLPTNAMGTDAKYVAGGETLEDGTNQVAYTAAFDALTPEAQSDVLDRLQAAGLREMYQQKSISETDPILKEYYIGKLAGAEGNWALAQVKLMAFKKDTATTSDAKLLSLRGDACKDLRLMAMSTLDELQSDNQELLAQRLSHLGLAHGDRMTAEGNATLIKTLQAFIASGKADTIDEALSFLRSENSRLEKDFLKNPVIQKDWIVRYPYPERSETQAQQDKAIATEFQKQFLADPNTPLPPEVPSVTLDGGTLEYHNPTFDDTYPEQILLHITKAGGRVVTPRGQLYVFPPADHEKTVLFTNFGIILSGVTFDDFHAERAHVESLTGVRGDADGGHPNTFQGLVDHLDMLSSQDPDMAMLIRATSERSLATRTTPEGLRQGMLKNANALWHRDGSYQLAAGLFENVFGSELQIAMQKIPASERAQFKQQVTANHNATYAKVLASLSEQKDADPEQFKAAYPNGEASHAQIAALVDQAEAAALTKLYKDAAYKTLQSQYDAGTMSDPLSRTAWENFVDMEDPFHDTFNFQSASWDSIVDEVVITAVTMPFIMGAGSVVRLGVGVLAEEQLLALSARTGSSLAARGLVWGSGNAAMSGVQMIVSGQKITAQNFALNFAMFSAFDAGGKVWEGLAPSLGLSEESLASAKGWQSTLKNAGNTSGSILTQSLVGLGTSTANDILSDTDNPDTFAERFGAEVLRMAGYHYGLGAVQKAVGSKPAEIERRNTQRLKVAADEGSRMGEKVDVPRAVNNSLILVPRDQPTPGVAKTISMDDAKLIADRWAEIQKTGSDNYFYKCILRGQYDGIVVADTPFGPDGLRTMDHHGKYATPDNKNSTMKLLDLFDEVLKSKDGGIDAAIKELNIQAITTDNLADGMWCVWIAKNQERVLRDPALRDMIRLATQFEDFSAFGSNYNRADPAVELQAALFAKYDAILQANNIKGGDRFSPALADKILADGCRAIDKMLASPTARHEAAESFWKNVDAATETAKSEAVMPESVPDKVRFYDLKKMSQYPTLAQWLAIPQAHQLNLQVSVAPMPSATLSAGGQAPRNLMIVAIPDGRSLPSGKGLLSILKTVNAAEAAKANALGLEKPNSWFGKDNVILPNPANGGSVLTPAELAAVLTAPENGLFEVGTESPPTPSPESSTNLFPPLFQSENQSTSTAPISDETVAEITLSDSSIDEVPLSMLPRQPRPGQGEVTRPTPSKSRITVEPKPLATVQSEVQSLQTVDDVFQYMLSLDELPNLNTKMCEACSERIDQMALDHLIARDEKEYLMQNLRSLWLNATKMERSAARAMPEPPQKARDVEVTQEIAPKGSPTPVFSLELNSSAFSETEGTQALKGLAAATADGAPLVTLNITVDDVSKLNSVTLHKALRQEFAEKNIGAVQIIFHDQATGLDLPFDVPFAAKKTTLEYPSVSESEAHEILKKYYGDEAASVETRVARWSNEQQERFWSVVAADNADINSPHLIGNEKLNPLSKGADLFRIVETPKDPKADFQDTIETLIKNVDDFSAPIGNGREETFRRVNATPREAYEFQEANPKPENYREAHTTPAVFPDASGTPRTYQVPDYVMGKMDAWIRQHSFNLTTETQGNLTTETLDDGTILVTDFIPLPTYSQSFHGFRDDLKDIDPLAAINTKKLTSVSFSPYLNYILGIDFGDEYKIPTSTSVIPLHSHYTGSKYQRTPSNGDFASPAEKGKIRALWTPEGGLIFYAAKGGNIDKNQSTIVVPQKPK